MIVWTPEQNNCTKSQAFDGYEITVSTVLNKISLSPKNPETKKITEADDTKIKRMSLLIVSEFEVLNCNEK